MFGKLKRNSDGLSNVCKCCKREYDKKYYEEKVNKDRKVVLQKSRRRELRFGLVKFLKKNPCVDCGEKNPVVLELDHIRDKEFNVSDMISRGMSWKSIKKEIKKCEVRCANCHRIKTARDFNWYETR